MASIITADNGTVSGSAGLKSAADSSGILALATGSGTTAVTIDATQNVGIGTSSPSADSSLHVFAATDKARISVQRNGVSKAYMAQDGGGDFYLWNEANANIRFYNNNTERARIDSSGNLIQSAPTTPPSLATNGTMVFNLTSNTNLRVSVRGSDGVTRTANLILV